MKIRELESPVKSVPTVTGTVYTDNRNAAAIVRYSFFDWLNIKAFDLDAYTDEDGDWVLAFTSLPTPIWDRFRRVWGRDDKGMTPYYPNAVGWSIRGRGSKV